jgi:hypothetical protein
MVSRSLTTPSPPPRGSAHYHGCPLANRGHLKHLQTSAVLVSAEWDTPDQVAALRALFAGEAGGVAGAEG